MFEFSKLTEDNINQYMVQLTDDLKYLFTHVDESNMTADMRERWERVITQFEELKSQVKEMQSTLTFVKRKVEIAYTLIGNLKDNAAKIMSVGSYMIDVADEGAANLSSRYGGTWTAQPGFSITLQNGFILGLFKRTA